MAIYKRFIQKKTINDTSQFFKFKIITNRDEQNILNGWCVSHIVKSDGSASVNEKQNMRRKQHKITKEVSHLISLKTTPCNMDNIMKKNSNHTELLYTFDKYVMREVKRVYQSIQQTVLRVRVSILSLFVLTFMISYFIIRTQISNSLQERNKKGFILIWSSMFLVSTAFKIQLNFI